MAKLIDKDALVAEIESKRKYAQNLGDNAINSSMQQFYDGMKQGCVDLLSFLDTLEVKEVDFEEYYHKFLQKEWFGNSHVRTVSEMMAFTAKHFFELGLKTKQTTI